MQAVQFDAHGGREVLPMSEVREGHRLLEEREGFGKVVLVPDRRYDGGDDP